jgi:hypothetical protein
MGDGSKDVAERVEEAAAVVVLAEAVEAAAEPADRGKVYADAETTGAQIASLNSAVAMLDERLFRLEAIARRQGF